LSSRLKWRRVRADQLGFEIIRRNCRVRRRGDKHRRLPNKKTAPGDASAGSASAFDIATRHLRGKKNLAPESARFRTRMRGDEGSVMDCQDAVMMMVMMVVVHDDDVIGQGDRREECNGGDQNDGSQKFLQH
jgi:hypothetical protein